MKINTATLPFTGRKIRIRGFRSAEFLMVAFFGIVMGLPLLFMLHGSFNIAPPGKEAIYRPLPNPRR